MGGVADDGVLDCITSWKTLAGAFLGFSAKR